MPVCRQYDRPCSEVQDCSFRGFNDDRCPFAIPVDDQVPIPLVIAIEPHPKAEDLLKSV